MGLAVFAFFGAFDLAAIMVGEQLGAVANAQYGTTADHAIQIETQGIFLAYRKGTPGQDDAFDIGRQFGQLVEGNDLTIDIGLPYAAGYELGVLRPEVEDQNFFHKSGRKGSAFF